MGTTKPSDTNRTLLIVQGYEAFARQVERFQFRHGWNTTTAYNAPQALKALAQCADLHVALVEQDLIGGECDARSSGGAGLEVAARIRGKFPNATIVITCPARTARMTRAASELGAKCWYHGEELSELVRLAKA